MQGYLEAVNRSIKDYRSFTGVSSAKLARALGITVGTFTAKVNGHRPWRVEELYTLAQIGVPIPDFSARYRRKDF